VAELRIERLGKPQDTKVATRMAESHTKYGHLDQLQPGKDKIEEYYQRFLLYCTANELTDAGKMKAIFLTSVGGATYALLANLVSPAKPQDRSLDELIKLLKDHHEPKKIVIAERFKFYKRQQREGESIANYLAELRRLAKDCEFGDGLTTALRDQLVCGLHHEGLQQKILAERELTLEKALSLAQAYEAARQEMKMLRGEGGRQTPHQSSETAFTVKASGSRRSFSKGTAAGERVCYRCEGRGHDSDRCWYKSSMCQFCNIRGHIAKACRKRKQMEQKGGQKSHNSKPPIQKQPQKPSQKSRPNPTYQVEDDEEVSLNYTLTDKPVSPKVQVEVAGTLLTMDVDTGASLTVIPAHIFRRVLTHVQLQKSNVKLQTYSGEALTVKGEAFVPIRYGDQTAHEKMVVVEVKNKPAVLGRNWLAHIRLDWHKLFKVERQPETDKTHSTEYTAKYSQLFEPGMGSLNGYEASITLKPGSVPKFHRPRPVPYALQQKVDEELDRLQKEGILQSVDRSEWASPIVVVRKANGSVRVCGDYKVSINPYLETERYPMPNPQDLFSTLAGGKVFTRLDMKQAYQQMKVSPDSQEYLTINTSKGLFIYTRMPFGITSAPAIWQKAMDEILAGIPGCLCYLDDILVVGSSQEEHDQRLDTVLDRLSRRGIRLQREKCLFSTSEVEYLGHVISEKGLRPMESKYRAIKDAPQPQNLTQLKSYLGLLNYYSRFLPNISTTLQPLYKLFQKSQPWIWTKEQQEAFVNSKEKLLASDCLTHYDLNKPLRLKCDASPQGIGACLTHVMSDGSEQPIAFTSRTLSTAEKGYAQLEKEALALINGVRQFHKYLIGRKFTLVTDHRPLVKILGPKEGIPTLAAARLQRWAIILSAYDYDLEFTAGSSNQEADMLSILPLPVEGVDPNEVTYYVDYLDTLPVTADQVKQATRNDPILRQALRYTLEGWPESVPPELYSYARRATELTVTEGCLIYGGRVVIPNELQKQVLSELHTEHTGISRMKAIARSFIWWPNLEADIERLVKACPRCQEQRNKPAITTPTHPWVYPGGPWERVHADFAEYGGKYYLLLVDAFSKWPEVHELHADSSSQKTVECMRRTFSTHGIPRYMVTDNGPQFRSEEFQRFMGTNGIRHQLTPPYHPATNGQVERMVQQLKKSLKSKPTDRSWSHQVSSFLFHYRTTPHSITGKTPAELLLKRMLRTRLSLVRPEAGQNIRDRQRSDYNEAVSKVREFNPGDRVSVWNPRKDGRNKWLPGTVVQRLGPTSYLVNVEERVRYVHIDHLTSREAMSTQTVTSGDSSLAESLPTSAESAVSSPSSTTSLGSTTEKIPQQETSITNGSGATQETTENQDDRRPTNERRYPVRQNRQPPIRYRQS
jgi:hypothetical protein